MPTGASLLLPERLLDVERSGRNDPLIVPRYLTERDAVWLERMCDVFMAAVGRSRHDLERRLDAVRLPACPRRRWRAMACLLTRLHRFEVAAPVKPHELRQLVFGAAAACRRRGGQVATVLDAPAGDHATTPDVVASWLYADLPENRLLCQSSSLPSTRELIERYNLALAKSVLLRARKVTVHVEAQLKGLLRFARLQGLLCLARTAGTSASYHGHVMAAPSATRACLELSGPLSVLRQTVKYGRSLAAWLPVVVRTPNWSLEAECLYDGRAGRFIASARDPLGTTHAPLRRFDSKLEERFFRDLERRDPNWQVLREADAFQIGRRIVSADFCLVHRRNGQRVLVEIVGFWTERYLKDKLEIVRALPPSHRWLLCVDESLDSEVAQTLAGLPNAFCFRRRIDIDAFVRHLGRLLPRASDAISNDPSC